jgi:hypothetical protein
LRISGASDHLNIANIYADGQIPAGTLPHGMHVSASPGPTDINFYNVEVRTSDYGWGVENDRNLLGRFASRTFSLPRLGTAQTYFLRQHDGSSPAKYSRFSTALHIDYPL